MASAAAGIQRANRPSSASTRSTSTFAKAAECCARSSAGPWVSIFASASARNRLRAWVLTVKARRSASRPSPARSSAKAANAAAMAKDGICPAKPCASNAPAQNAWAMAAMVPTSDSQTTRATPRRLAVCWPRSQDLVKLGDSVMSRWFN